MLNGQEKELNAIRLQLKEHNTANSKKEELIKDIERDFNHQKARMAELEAEIKTKNVEIMDLLRLADVGRRFEKIKETEGDCTIIGKKEMDQLKERQSMLFKDNKLLEETIKKKNAKIVELSESQEALQGELAKLNKDLKSRTTEIEKMIIKSKEFEAEKSKLNNTIADQKAEIRELKGKLDKNQDDNKRKLKEIEEKSKKNDGLGSDIQNLKEQLDKKIKQMNSLSNKNASLSESEARLREEIKKAENLAKANQEINGMLSQSELHLAELRKELRLKEEQLDQLRNINSEKSTITDVIIKQLRDENKNLKNELDAVKSVRDNLQEASKTTKLSLMETSTKLKGALQRLEEAEKVLGKYDIPALEKKILDLEDKGLAMGKAAEKIRLTMEMIRISVLCKKCDNFPKDGKTYFPCGHSYCSGCDNPSATSCSDCKKNIETRVLNPLINDVKMNYEHMHGVIGLMIETSNNFSKPKIS